MIHTSTVTLAGESCVLLILPPDWSRALRVTAQIPVELDESVTGVQERRAGASVPRWAMSYDAYLEGTELQTLRAVMGGLAGKRVAVPFWPDAAWSDVDWSERLLNGQAHAAWADGVGAITSPVVSTVAVVNLGVADPEEEVTAPAGTLGIGSDGSIWYKASGSGNTGWVAKDQAAALLVGRLSVTFDAITPDSADLDLSIIEDSDWSLRLTPRETDPAAWDETWELNWSKDPRQDQRTLEDYDSIGRSRVQAQTGDTARVWRQKAALQLDRQQLAELVAFWAARKAGHEAFDLPSALQPGVETTAAPHAFDTGNGQVRFADKELRIDLVDPALAELQIQFEQQIETADHEEAPASYAYLYKWTYEGTSAYLTDWESPISALSQTWTPARVEHGRLRQSLKPQNEDCEITVWLDDLALIQPMLRMESESPVSVIIYEMELPAGTPQMLFSGSAWTARGTGKKVKVKAAAFGGVMSQRLPRFMHSVDCNHTLFSHGCIRRRPTQMAQSAWQSTGLYQDQWADAKVLLHTPSFATPVGVSPADHFFKGGWLETGSGSTRQVREITGSWLITGVVYLLLARPLRTDLIAANQQVRFWPGCDGQYSTCGTKFTNTLNFGGMPFQPAWIEQAPMGMPSGGK